MALYHCLNGECKYYKEPLEMPTEQDNQICPDCGATMVGIDKMRIPILKYSPSNPYRR